MVSMFIKAARNGTVQIVQDYINSGADLNVREEYGWTALHSASKWGKTGCLSLLIGAGADLNVQHEKYGWTAIHLTSQWDKTVCLSLLIKAGADYDVQTKVGQTALHLVSWKGKTECVKLLIAAGADLNILEEDGYTALHLASCNGKTECVKLLIKAGADLNIRTTKEWLNYKAGNQAIDIAREQQHAEIVKLLLESIMTTKIQSLLRMYLKRKDYLEILSLKPNGSGYLKVKAEFESLASR